MSTIHDEPTQHRQEHLAGELRALEAQEAALERRTRSLEISNPLALIFSFLALALGAGALIVALNGDSNDSGSTVATGGAAGVRSPMIGGRTSPARMASSGGAMMMGVGGRGRFTTAQVAAAKGGSVHVQLGDIWVAPAVGSVRAGKVTFVAKNVGRLKHELMVERMPIKMDAPMQPNEDAAQGMIPDMDGGGSGRISLRLKPGLYMLFCNVEGHYAAGQHIPFRVT